MNTDCGLGGSCTGSQFFFCPGQQHGGAFGKTSTACIQESGSPAGNLTDNMPHVATEGVVFCIPPTLSGSLNGVADVPGPAATALPGLSQLVPTPIP